MDLGRELVACALRAGTLKPFTDAGISHDWLTSEQDVSHAAIFDAEDYHAWKLLLDHWAKHSKMPSPDLFRRSFPDESYRLPETTYLPEELIEVWRGDRQKYLTQVAASDIADLVAEGNITGAVALMEHAARLIRETYESRSIIVDWDDPEYDVEARIHRKIRRGVLTGIPGLDRQFYGYQAGNLICYLGRAKAGKTSFALLSALAAWEQGKRVLFLSFEIAAGKLPEEPGISDRLDSFGSHIDLLRYMMGELTKQEQQLLREFRENCTDQAFRIVQPTSSYTVTELEADIDDFRPDVVYIDGFYFMTDRVTGKSGANWEGHDSLAAELKSVAMGRMIPVIITHQVREKQLTGKKGKGIDDGAMMGGTAIIMFADIVLGVDVDDDKLRTISCTRSRLNYLETIQGTWDWTVCVFNEQAARVREDDFAYGGRNDDE